MSIDYIAGPATKPYANGYTDIFTHHDTTNCPVTACKLMNSDCTVDLSNSNFYMTNGNTPWAVTAK